MMRKKFLFIVTLALICSLILIGHAVLAAPQDSETYTNLYASVQGETNAAASYNAFAAKALEEGHEVIARLFTATAQAEAKHAEDEWSILVSMGATERPTAAAPTVGTTAQNLQTAFNGETYEYTVMYPEFLAAAQAEGVADAARIFNLAMRAEEVHAGNFADVLALLLSGNESTINSKYSIIYRCVTCGEVVTKLPDPRCPICGAASTTFIKYGGTYANLYASVQGETNAVANYRAFAARALEEGYAVIAQLFSATAEAEAKHAEDEWAILVSMGATERPTAAAPAVGSTIQNLQAAFAGETYEYTVMYPEFLAAAQAEGVADAARIFNLAMRAEEIHAGNYADVLALLLAGNLATINSKYATIYRCVTCGEVVTKLPDSRCPICGAPSDTFVRYAGTYANLYAAVQGETNAAASYRAYAAQARAEGYAMIAQLYEATADAEAKHAEDEWAILVSMGATQRPAAAAPTVGTTAQNLQASFEGETYEYTVMYPEFLAIAQAEGIADAARIFRLAMRAEEIHAGNYADVLSLLQAGDVAGINAKYAIVYRCVTCGEVVTTLPDPRCPICGAASDTFVKYGGGLTVNFTGVKNVKVQYYTNVAGWVNAGVFDDTCVFTIPDQYRATWGATTVQAVKDGMYHTFTLATLDGSPVLDVPVKTITVLGIAAACDLAIVQNDWVYPFAPAAFGEQNIFNVFDNGNNYEVRLYRPGFYPINITGVQAGQTVNFGSSYFYQVEVPAGVRDVWVSSYDWAVRGASAGESILLLCDSSGVKRDAKMSFVYDGKTYSVEFKLDGTNPFELVDF